MLDVWSLALRDTLRQMVHGVRLPRQGGAQFFADGPRAGHRLRPIGILQQGGHDLLRGALVGAHRIEPCDDGLLLGALLPLA